MSNPTFKPSEGKREEFRKYLEKGGVMDALTKVLVNLYEEPEKPEDALEYIRDRLAMQAGIEIHSEMKTRLEELQTRIDDMTQELESLKAAAEQPLREGEGGEALLDQIPPEGEEGMPPPEGEMPRASAAGGQDAGRASAAPPPEGEQQPAEPPTEPPAEPPAENPPE